MDTAFKKKSSLNIKIFFVMIFIMCTRIILMIELKNISKKLIYTFLDSLILKKETCLIRLFF